MSRYDYRDPGTDPAYCDPLRAEDDIDVPDFDAPDDAKELVDPAEHALSSILAALNDIERAIEQTPDFDRLMLLWKMAREAETHAADIVNLAARTVDQILERRR